MPVTGAPASVTRRGFLAGAGALAGAAMVGGACSDDESPSSTAGDGQPATSEGSDDLEVAGRAAGLEVLVVETYEATIEAAKAGKLGDVPPAVNAFLAAAVAHHQAHREAWNARLVAAGRTGVGDAHARLKPTVDAQLGRASTVADALALARRLEETAAATYLSAMPALRDGEAVQLAASIQATDAKHVAILLFLQGDYPVPDVFAKTDLAART